MTSEITVESLRDFIFHNVHNKNKIRKFMFNNRSEVEKHIRLGFTDYMNLFTRCGLDLIDFLPNEELSFIVLSMEINPSRPGIQKFWDAIYEAIE